jgi:hypothetical protein
MKELTYRKTVHGITIFAIASAIFLTLSTMGIPLVRWEFSRDAEATIMEDNGCTLEPEVDHVRIINQAPGFACTFTQEEDMATEFDDTHGGPNQLDMSYGYLYMDCNNDNIWLQENFTMTGTSALFEMMWRGYDREAQDNFTMKIENLTDKSNISIVAQGDGDFVTIYTNATGVKTEVVNTGQFDQDEWYVWQIFINDNNTADTNIRWKENFSIIPDGAVHITTCNLSTPDDADTLWINNTEPNVASNGYILEYVFADDNSAMGELPADTSANFENIQPKESEKLQHRIRQDDVDISDAIDAIWDGNETDDRTHYNCSGGENVTDALNYMDYTIPNNLSHALDNHSDESYWSWKDFGEVVQLVSEQNESEDSDHFDFLEVTFADDDLEQRFKDIMKGQFDITDVEDDDDDDDDDDEVGYVVSYRIDDLYFKFVPSEDMVNRVESVLDDAIDKSDADVQAYTWPWEDLPSGVSGDGSDILDLIKDTIPAMNEDVIGLAAFWKNDGDSISGGILPDWELPSSGEAMWVFTNALIGQIIKGAKELLFGMWHLLVNGTLQAMNHAFSFIWAGTIQNAWFWVVIGAIFIIPLAIMWWVGIGPFAAGGKLGKYRKDQMFE